MYSYTLAGGNKVYVVKETTTVSGGVTTVSYQAVQIHAAVNRDGIDETGLTAAEVATPPVPGAAEGDELVHVTARLPVRVAYEHLNFGTWAALDKAKASGAHDPGSLGIGFVQAIGDHGMTAAASMLNNGKASYTGNWVANILAAHPDGEGDISAQQGKAALTADFGKDTLKAVLTGLATLDSSISGNGFSGTKVTVMDDAKGGLDATGTFTGTTEGNFFGPKAAEAGGVFDYDGGNAGAFVGAFGAAKAE